jgi:hypothetical protein
MVLGPCKRVPRWPPYFTRQKTPQTLVGGNHDANGSQKAIRQDDKPTTTGGAHLRKDERGATVTEQFLQRNLGARKRTGTRRGEQA